MAADNGDYSFHILGAVQVLAAGEPLRFARRQQLDLLAYLLLHAGRVVTDDQLIDAMWGEAAPRTASTQIKNMVSALRGALHHHTHTLATVERHAAGYKLRLAAGELDLAAFTSRDTEARTADTPETAVRLLREAIALWHGPVPLAGVRAAFAGTARTYLRERRDTALERMFDAELACANHAKIVPELTDVVADNPGRERFVAQLMTALYRSGRTSDALAAFQQARRRLAEEYGLEPGPPLRELERQILLGDPTLAPPADRRPEPAAAPSPAAPVDLERRHPERDPPPERYSAPERVGAAPGGPGRPVARPVPAQLPPDLGGFVGRDPQLTALNALIPDRAEKPAALIVTAVMGTAGVGKTALAVHWAHQVRDRFPDGQLYVDLRGFHPGAAPMRTATAIRGFLDAFAVPPDQIPVDLDAQVALYRSVVAGRRLLVLLDNALDTEQVRPLLPGTPGCLVVVTSRNRLVGLVTVEGAVPLTLDVLTEAEAGQLLVRRLGAARVAAEPSVVADIAARCARLPLALALVAAQAAIHPTFPLAALATELSATQDRRAAVAGDVWTATSWSYRRLEPAAAELFRLLGLHPGPDLGTDAAASLTGQPVARVRPLLADLTKAHLVTEHAPGRYGLHNLLRGYAAELARTVDPEPRRQAAVHRVLDHYLHTAYAAAVLMYPHRYQLDLVPAHHPAMATRLADAEQAAAWFQTEHAVLLAALDLAAEAGLASHTWQLASALATYFARRCHWRDWAAAQRTALAAAERTGDRAGQAHASGSLGMACSRLHQYEEAHGHLRRAADLFTELGDVVGLAYTHLQLSGGYGGQGEPAAALDHAERALARFRTAGHRAGCAQALNSIGWYHAQLGRYRAAIVHCEQAAARHRELGNREGVAHTLDSLGFAHHHLGQHRQAVACYQEALELLREAGDHYYQTIALTHLGDTQLAAGDRAAATDAWQQALDILYELGHPDAEQVHARLRRSAPEPDRSV